MQTQFIQISRNSKIGAISASYTTKKACPNSCPLKDMGCYSDGGHSAIAWQAVTNEKRGASFSEFLQDIKTKVIKGALWRHNVAGDLVSDGETIDRDALAGLVKANKGKRGFTYTHHRVIDHKGNREAVRDANKRGFTINLSGNNPAHADKLASLGIAPVVTILPQEYQKTKKESLSDYKKRLASLPKKTPQGRAIAVCPATFIDAVNCANCGLCQNNQRRSIVGFPAHGFRKAKADQIATKREI